MPRGYLGCSSLFPASWSRAKKAAAPRVAEFRSATRSGIISVVGYQAQFDRTVGTQHLDHIHVQPCKSPFSSHWTVRTSPTPRSPLRTIGGNLA